MDCFTPLGTTTQACFNMYATSSFLSTFNGAASDTGYVVSIVVSAVVAGAVALMGLGMGIRHLRRYITGRKF